MTVSLRAADCNDIPFLKQMLYEAAFWRKNRPSFDEALAYPEVADALVGWGERDGDAAVVATDGGEPVGAAWIRRWNEEDCVNGFVDASTPVLGIAVRRDYRRRGIGRDLIGWLVDHSAAHGIARISLNVSKDNQAIRLYRRLDFEQVADAGDSLVMARPIVPQQRCDHR